MKQKEYLGDGVYVEINESGDVVLTTENGLEITNRIVLEASIFQALVEYLG